MSRRHRNLSRRTAVNALALASALAALLHPAQAATLGEITLDSRLGQPLNARIPLRLYPGESLGPGCVTVPTTRTPEFGRLPSATISSPEVTQPGTYELRVATTQSLYEPIYELQVQVRCPGTALMVRDYVLMLDLPGMPAPSTSASLLAIPEAAGPETPAPPADAPLDMATAPSRPARPRVEPGAPIAAGSRYRVAAGDTLSTIAARVADRGNEGLWTVAERIRASNPDAFIGGDADLIKLGSEITIPGPVTTPVPESAAAQVQPQVDAAPPAASAATAQAAAVPVRAGPAAATLPASPAAPLADVAVAPVVEAREQAATDAPPTRAARVTPVTTVADDGFALGWWGTLLGLLLGTVVSLLLLRKWLPDSLRSLLPGRRQIAVAPLGSDAPADADADGSEDSDLDPAVVPPRFNRPFVPREPSMVVVEERHAETLEEPADLHAAAEQPGFEDGLPDSDLSQLFADDATAAGQVADYGATAALRGNLDLDLSAATADSLVDEDIGALGDDTMETPTTEAPRPVAAGGSAEHIDLQTLTQRAIEDDQVSRTLEEALNLLESDYEDELTASQMIDRRRLQGALGDDPVEDSLVRTGTDQFPRRR